MVTAERATGKSKKKKNRKGCVGLYLDTKSGLSLLCNSVRISSLNHLMALFLHKYLFSWHLLPLTFIQSLSLIHFPKYILDIHPLLFKTIASPYSKILEPLNWPFPSSLPLPLLSPLIFFTLHSEGLLSGFPFPMPMSRTHDPSHCLQDSAYFSSLIMYHLLPYSLYLSHADFL